MASEYSVNIKLNTAQVKRDLKTIGDGIGNLGKKQARGSKSALSDSEKQLKLENQSIRLQNQGLGLTLKSLPLAKKGVDLEKIKLGIKDGIADAEKFEFDLARKSLLLTDKEIKKEQILLKTNQDITKSKATQIKIQRQMASPIGGSKFMMGSPAQMAFSGGPSVPVGGSRFITGSPAQLAHSAKVGGPRSPIGGLASIPGSPAALKGMRGFDFQSALISGGFPLLFGQGPIGALAGGLGGGIGGMFGQMGGFAGGIAATALVQQVQTFIDSTSKLGQAMSSLTPDTNALAQAMGIVGTQEEKRIQAIEKLNGKQAALTAAMDKMRETIGDKEVDRLKAFGETTRLIGNEFAIAMTKMQAFGVRFINLFDKIFGLSASAEKSQRDRAIENSTNPEILRIQSEIEEVKKGRMRGSRRDKRLKVLRDELKVLGDQEVKTNKIAAKNETDRLTLEASLRATTDKTKLLQDTLQFGEQEAQIRQRILQFERDSGVVLDANGKKRIRDAMELERSLQRQVDFTKAIGASFRDSFRDAITGATSFGQAMSNVLNTIRDRLINMYLDQMFAQATMGRKGGGGIFGNLLGGLLGGVFGGGGFSITGGATNTALTSAQQIAKDTAMYGNTFPAGSFANGGFAQRGKSYLVGERGPELFTPGATGGQISPMGSTNIVVNVDASGSSVEGNESESQVLGQVLASAIQSELIKQKRPGGLLG